jgi:hypothetical protein
MPPGLLAGAGLSGLGVRAGRTQQEPTFLRQARPAETQHADECGVPSERLMAASPADRRLRLPALGLRGRGGPVDARLPVIQLWSGAD